MLKLTEVFENQIPLVKELFKEYASTLDFDLAFQGFAEELKSLPGNYSSPSGSIFLAYYNSVLAGCAAVRPLSDGICEMKRLYVRPQFQGLGIGRALTLAVLNKAASIGYTTIRLDTVPTMQAAIKMYRSMGFYEIPPYRLNPVSGTLYFEKNLSSLTP